MKPDKWIIIDDGPQPLPKELLQKSAVPIEYGWYKQFLPASTPFNSAQALARVSTQKCIFIDDDDYYPPTYIEALSQKLDNKENTLVAEEKWIDYRLSTGYYRIRHLHTESYRPGCTFFEWHSAGITGKELREYMQKVLLANPNGRYNDRTCYENIFLKGIFSFLTVDFGKDSCISLKDYGTGNPGAIKTHFSNDGMTEDKDFKFFKEHLGEDWHRYEKYLGRLK